MDIIDVRNKFYPVIIEMTIGFVFYPSTALYTPIGFVLYPSTALYIPFLKCCALTNKVVGTI